MNIFVGCSSCNIDEYMEFAFDLGVEIAKEGHSLVFGASYLGLMKALVDGCNKNNGKIIGIVPECYREVAYNSCCQLVTTTTISERKMKLIEISDAFIFLPGGFGTVDELLSVFEEKRGGCLNKPIVIINIKGHYNKFIEFINEFIKANFAKKSDLDLISVVDSVEAAMSLLKK